MQWCHALIEQECTHACKYNMIGEASHYFECDSDFDMRLYRSDPFTQLWNNDSLRSNLRCY